MGIGGGIAGAAKGGAIGFGVGGTVGYGMGFIACASNSGGSGGSGTGSASSKFNPRDPGHRQMTADKIIQQFKKGGIRSEFPGEMLQKTFNQIDAAAKKGEAAAQTARKLLTDSRFAK